MSLIHLSDRGVVRVSGPDANTLLNGLLTNDVTKASANSAIYAAMLTPQGKYLFDMLVLALDSESFILDVSRAADFTKRLMMYRLRSKVTIENITATHAVYADIANQSDVTHGIVLTDPRHPQLGKRVIGPSAQGAISGAYLAHCIGLGVPDPAADLLVEKDFILEGLFDELGGIDFHKGCYVGQEMTSRMKRRTSVKNKLCRVRYEGPAPAFETPIVADGWEVGRMRTGIDGVGIAMIRFDRVAKAKAEGHVLMAGDLAIEIAPPEWLILPSG
jgi:tRNA-modifying protein YgfZ